MSSPPSEKDPARAWRAIQALIDEEDEEELAKLSDEEAVAAIEKEAARYPGKAPDLEAFLAKVHAKGVVANAGEAGAAVLESASVGAAEPAVPSAVAGPEAGVGAAPAGAGAGKTPAGDARTPAGDARANVVAFPLRRWWPVLALAAAAGTALVVGTNDDDSGKVGAPAEPTPAEKAANLRVGADVRCRQQQWDACLKMLDDAKALDPAGDADAKVQTLRAMAVEGRGK
jgi:hypothetical protein